MERARIFAKDTVGARKLDRASKVPLWSQLREDIERRIAASEFQEDFPGEHSLREEYEVSRQTVRFALRSLREAGVISAARGQKSEVVRAELKQSLGTLYSIFDTVEKAGMEQKSDVLSMDLRLEPMVAEHLNVSAETELFFLHRLRWAGDEPLALDQVWLPGTIGEPLLEKDFSSTGLYQELGRCCELRPTGGEEEIDAVILSDYEAGLLQVAPGSAAFSVRRTSQVGQRTIECRQTIFRADRFRFSAQFSQNTQVAEMVPDVSPERGLFLPSVQE